MKSGSFPSADALCVPGGGAGRIGPRHAGTDRADGLAALFAALCLRRRRAGRGLRRRIRFGIRIVRAEQALEHRQVACVVDRLLACLPNIELGQEGLRYSLLNIAVQAAAQKSDTEHSGKNGPRRNGLHKQIRRKPVLTVRSRRFPSPRRFPRQRTRTLRSSAAGRDVAQTLRPFPRRAFTIHPVHTHPSCSSILSEAGEYVGFKDYSKTCPHGGAGPGRLGPRRGAGRERLRLRAGRGADRTETRRKEPARGGGKGTGRMQARGGKGERAVVRHITAARHGGKRNVQDRPGRRCGAGTRAGSADARKAAETSKKTRCTGRRRLQGHLRAGLCINAPRGLHGKAYDKTKRRSFPRRFMQFSGGAYRVGESRKSRGGRPYGPGAAISAARTPRRGWRRAHPARAGSGLRTKRRPPCFYRK